LDFANHGEIVEWAAAYLCGIKTAGQQPADTEAEAVVQYLGEMIDLDCTHRLAIRDPG